MHKCRLLALGMVIGVLAPGARAEDPPAKPDYAKLLVGKWEVTKGDGSLRVGVVMEYRKDGTMKMSNWEPSVRSGSYKVQGDKILVTLRLHGGKEPERKEPATIRKLTDEELELTFESGEMVYELKRKK